MAKSEIDYLKSIDNTLKKILNVLEKQKRRKSIDDLIDTVNIDREELAQRIVKGR